MKILFFLGHPAHYHLFRVIIKNLINKNHTCVLVVRPKDILENLIQEDNVNYILIYGRNNRIFRRKNKMQILIVSLIELIYRDFRLGKICSRRKMDLLVGTETSIAHIGKILKIPSLIFNEDDININPEFCIPTYPFADHIVSPTVCHVGYWKYKKISYNGYQKLAYLHPRNFNPDINKISEYINIHKPIYLVRVVSLKASHDAIIGQNGLNVEILVKLISILENYGEVYISTEDDLPRLFDKYLINIPFNLIHHLLFFCDLFIGDSQSMAVEAAILGVPSIRFNNFVGKISVLEELEEYGLSIGIKGDKPEKLLQTVSNIIKMKGLKILYQEKRYRMLDEKINVSSFFTWLIENYPRSIETLKKNPDFQVNFNEK